MKDYFDEKGHLTDMALEELIHGQPDEIVRLEIAEHLSFCDRCLERYTEMLTPSVLVAPEPSNVAQIMRRIRYRAKTIFFHKYATLAVAACLALVLWTSGMFHIDGESLDRLRYSEIVVRTEQMAERTENFTDYIANQFVTVIDYFRAERSFDHE